MGQLGDFLNDNNGTQEKMLDGYGGSSTMKYLGNSASIEESHSKEGELESFLNNKNAGEYQAQMLKGYGEAGVSNASQNYQQQMIKGYAGSSSAPHVPLDQEEADKAEESQIAQDSESTVSQDSETQKPLEGIEVKSDPAITLPDIEVPVNAAGPNETGKGEGEDTEQQQTKSTGILTPLLKIGNTVIPETSIGHLELTCDTRYPSLTVTFTDTFNLIDTFDKPRPDNNFVQLQILPPFDNIYKKINLTFWIDEYSKEGEEVTLEATYDVTELYKMQMKAYGEITTYEFFEKVASDLQIGFASNIVNTEVEFGGSESQVLDWWIDWWNYLNLIDITERTKTIDKELKVWSIPSKWPETDSSYTSDPIETEAIITNHTTFRNMSLYASDYTEDFSPLTTTDKVVEYYNMVTLEQDTFELMDKDVRNDTCFAYEYFGECFREFNYLKSKAINSLWLRKINSSAIEVTLDQPCLGLVRGSKVNFYWYTVNEFTKDTEDVEIETNVALDEDTISDPMCKDPDQIDGKQILDKQISGQYYITEVRIEYDFSQGDYVWKQHLTLIRPEDQKDYFDWSAVKIPEDQQ